MFLLLIDTSGIQDYVLGSNEMKIITQASESVEQLAGKFSALAQSESVRLIMAAGGNAAFCAESEAPLKRLCGALSRDLITNYPGLEVVAVIHLYDKGQLAQEYRNAGACLEQKKLTQQRSVPFTFPGTEFAEKEIRSVIEPYKDTHYIKPNQTDNQLIVQIKRKKQSQIGSEEEDTTEESDLMAFVAMDGLRMGGKFFEWLTHAENEEYDDEAFIREFRMWSDYLKERWEDAWDNAIQDLCEVFPAENPKFFHRKQGDRYLQLNWVMEKSSPHASKPYLPLRKIFQGGDDLTFICDAHIALAFVRNLIHYLEKEDSMEGIPKIFQNITVSAGIVVLDSHFPFVRANNLAGEVRDGAKKVAVGANPRKPPSRMDWWINRSGALKREYNLGFEIVKDREKKPPITSAVRPCAPQAWDRFEKENLTGAWAALTASRNKLKELGVVAQIGPEAVKQFLALRRVPLADDPNAKSSTLDFLPEGQREDGFDGSRTALLDITELFDLHFPLPRRGSNGGVE